MRNGAGRLGLVRDQLNFVGLLYMIICERRRRRNSITWQVVDRRPWPASSALSAAYSARLYDDACHAFEVYNYNWSFVSRWVCRRAAANGRTDATWADLQRHTPDIKNMLRKFEMTALLNCLSLQLSKTIQPNHTSKEAKDQPLIVILVLKIEDR